MTIPIVILLAALSLFVLLGIYVVHVGDRDDDRFTGAAGLVMIALAVSCAAAVGTLPAAPACHLNPASLAVEKTP